MGRQSPEGGLLPKRGGDSQGGHPLESYFSLLNFLFVEKKRKFRPSGPSGLMFCCSEFKREPAAGTTPLKQLAQEAYTQAEQKYLEGAQEKWNPEKIIIYGVGFRGKELALEAGEGTLRPQF